MALEAMVPVLIQMQMRPRFVPVANPSTYSLEVNADLMRVNEPVLSRPTSRSVRSLPMGKSFVFVSEDRQRLHQTYHATMNQPPLHLLKLREHPTKMTY